MLATLLFAFTACTLPNDETLTPQVATQPPTAQTWQQLAPGLDTRLYDYDGRTQLRVVRVDPASYTFHVHYEPGTTRSLFDWQNTLPNHVALINANYYDTDFRALGLTIADGQVYGTPYTDRGGMFYVESGQPGIRSNISQPYANEPFEQAVQAWPMLMQNGISAYNANSRSARRSAIAIDAEGRVLLIVTSRGSTTLAGLSAFLAESDMGIVNAFNLDGGGSTMLSVNTTDTQFHVNTFDTVPVVLAVYPR